MPKLDHAPQLLPFSRRSVLAAAALGSYAVGIEPMLLTRVKRYALTPPNWPDGLKLRVVALADIHACRPWMTPERIASLVEEANALEPDIIVRRWNPHGEQLGRLP